MNITIKDKACNLNPQPLKEGKMRKFVRRLKEAVAPTPAAIRYDGEVKQWAVLDKNLKPVRHFEMGLLSNVTFRSEKVERRLVGCGGGTSIDYAGIAEGDLQEGFLGRNHENYMNLHFSGGQFQNFNGEVITNASSVVLLPNRRAIYQP